MTSDEMADGIRADVGGFDDADDGQEHPGGVGKADGKEEAGQDAEVDDGQQGGAGGGHGALNFLVPGVYEECAEHDQSRRTGNLLDELVLPDERRQVERWDQEDRAPPAADEREQERRDDEREICPAGEAARVRRDEDPVIERPPEW